MQLSRPLSSLLLCLLVFASLSSQSQQIDKTSKFSKAEKMQLVWSDEFNYTGLPDPTKWNYDMGGWGWGNNELQYYTKD